jgi:hypothetical protein
MCYRLPERGASPCGLEVYDQLVSSRLHDRQIGGLLAFQNSPGVDANLASQVGSSFAKALGLTVPLTPQVTADEVIE